MSPTSDIEILGAELFWQYLLDNTFGVSPRSHRAHQGPALAAERLWLWLARGCGLFVLSDLRNSLCFEVF